jgi:hypothetical protein
VSIRGKAGFAFISFLILAGVVGAACGGDGATQSAGSFDAGGGVAAPMPAAAPKGGPDEGAAVLDEFQLPGISQKIIKTANVSVQVKKGTFQERFQQATMVASRHGGFVSSSSTAQARQRSGELIIRVPASEFEAVLGELKGLGTVRGEQLSGQDVTAQFVDLEARLRNWEAQEEVLLRLMRQSKTIEDSLKVQRTLQDVQLAIEEIRGQLRVLGDQTELSTITLSMLEGGSAATKPKEGLTFVRAWRQAIHAIATVLGAVVVGLGYVLPIVLVAFALLLMWLGYRRLRPRMAAGGTPSGTV